MPYNISLIIKTQQCRIRSHDLFYIISLLGPCSCGMLRRDKKLLEKQISDTRSLNQQRMDKFLQHLNISDDEMSVELKDMVRGK